MSEGCGTVFEDIGVWNESLVFVAGDDGVSWKDVEMVHVGIPIDHNYSPVVWQLGREDLSSAAACVEDAS